MIKFLNAKAPAHHIMVTRTALTLAYYTTLHLQPNYHPTDLSLRTPGGNSVHRTKLDAVCSVARLLQLIGQPNHLHSVSERPERGNSGWSQKNFCPALMSKSIWLLSTKGMATNN